jgi:hypothetical protein
VAVEGTPSPKQPVQIAKQIVQALTGARALQSSLAYVSGALLVAGGLALLARNTTRLAALVLTVQFLACA